MSADFNANKPFAAYWANTLFKTQLSEANDDIRELIGFGSAPEEPTPTPTPAAT